MNALPILSAIALLSVWFYPNPTLGQPTPDKQSNPYESHYVVYGFKEKSGGTQLLALDFIEPPIRTAAWCLNTKESCLP